MPFDFFDGFELDRKIESVEGKVFSLYKRRMDEEKVHELGVLRDESHIEIQLFYKGGRDHPREEVFFLQGEIDEIVDEFRAKMFELGGDKEYAEFIRKNPRCH